ncbi:hypothetical protein ACJJTC_016193 [Scirpophaga incertulas]
MSELEAQIQGAGGAKDTVSKVSRSAKQKTARLLSSILCYTMGLKDIASNYIQQMPNKDRPRPILVKFADDAGKSIVWRAKASLKTSSITLKEFLTRTRQTVFTRARLRFGIRACWT